MNPLNLPVYCMLGEPHQTLLSLIKNWKTLLKPAENLLGAAVNRLSLKHVIATPFPMSWFKAGLEPGLNFEPVLGVSKAKELALGKENWLQSGTYCLLA